MAGPATFSYNGPHRTGFSALTLEEVAAIDPNKQCTTGPLPSWLLMEPIGVLSPFLTPLMTVSLESGEFLSTRKHATATPRLKRPGLDPSDISNYRRAFNLPALSKLL